MTEQVVNRTRFELAEQTESKLEKKENSYKKEKLTHH